jgi:hypothetical protein
MRKVKVIQDQDSHWYVIPNELVDNFIKDALDDAMIDSGEFDAKWGEHKTGGDANNIQLYTGF